MALFAFQERAGMAVPNGTPGASDSGLPTVEAAAIDGALGDPFEIAQAAFNALPPADETPEPDASDSEPVAEASAEAVDSTAEPDEDADLASYPEAVREKFKALDPEERKALYEEAEKRAEARIKANEEKTQQLAATAAEQETRRKEILARTGQFVGTEAQTIELPNGNKIELPSREEMVRLSQNQRGRAELLDKYGLDDDSTEFWGHILDRSAQALDAAADLLDDQAWLKLDANLRDGIRASNLDPDTILSTAKSPTELISQLLSHVSSKYETQLAEQKAEYEGRLAARDVNAEGLRGRALAGSTRALATGGRSAGHTNGKVTTKQLIAEAGSIEAYTERAMRGDYAGITLSD